jgi:hypothetical protein
MKAHLRPLIFLMLFCFGATVNAQNETDSDIPACIPNILGKKLYDVKVLSFLNNPQLTVRKGNNPANDHNADWGTIPNWEGESPDYDFVLPTVEHRPGIFIRSIVFKAKSKASSTRCFKSLLAAWGLTNNPKDNEVILNEPSYIDKEVKKKGKKLHVSFKHNKQYGDENYAYSVLLTWNCSDKKNPWLEEVTISGNNNNLDKETCFDEKPVVLSRSKLDLDDEATYWRALGMKVTDSDRKAFVLSEKGWHYIDSLIISNDDNYMFKIIKEGESERISEVIYNHFFSEDCSSPLGQGDRIWPSRVEDRFGWNYRGFRLNDQNDKDIQIYGRDPARPTVSTFYFDIEVRVKYIYTVTMKAEDLKTFDNDMRLNLEDMLYSDKCFAGDCIDKIGSKYYSDGYLFIGEWRDGKQDFGPIYNRDKVVVEMIDNRISAEEAKANAIAKKIEEENKKTEKMQASVGGMSGTISACADDWNLYLEVMAKYHSKQYMIKNMKSALRLIVKCQEDCDDIVSKSKYVVGYFHDNNFCKEASPILLRMQQNAKELHKVFYDEMNRISTYSSRSDQQNEIDKIEPQMTKLHTALQDDCKAMIAKFNACVQAYNEKN